MTTLHATRGANFWSTRPVMRMDIAVGAYEDISSSDVPGFTDALMHAMPGLIEHRCSIGERGGFLIRLRDGTYAAHIIEHVALELQTMIGHDVGYGRTRGGDITGEYTLIFEHMHEAVGLRAAALALETVQQAFAGTLADVDHAVAELKALASNPDVPLLPFWTGRFIAFMLPRSCRLALLEYLTWVCAVSAEWPGQPPPCSMDLGG